jgi:putative nucleotidyltransferase with HDIG domain
MVSVSLLRSKNLIGRLKRLLKGIHPRLAQPDDTWAATRLPPPEYGVYIRMDARDREHALRVALKLLELHPNASDVLVRAALLHDCGKLLRRYVWLERIAVGFVQRPAETSIQLEGLLNRKYSALEIRLLHPLLGAALIRQAGGDGRVAEIVERHHSPRAHNDADATMIHDVDELE